MNTNIFLNSYKKKEDELTYAFFSMLEILDSREFFELISKSKLKNNPLKYMKLLPVGNNSNPDGELIFINENDVEFKLYFENKTKIRKLDKEQLLNHLTLCKQNDKLLVITPRKHDKIIIDEIKNKNIIFFTWQEIATELKNKYGDNIIVKQFIEYGNISGQFEELSEINRYDIINEIEKFKVKFDEKMGNILHTLKDKFETEKYKFSQENICIDDSDKYGRWGIEIYGKRKRKTYGQCIFIGYYYNTENHGINFKKDEIPEIVIFFDIYWDKDEINEEMMDKIIKDEYLCNGIKKLSKYDFENNLHNKNKDLRWHLFYKRKSIDEFDVLNTFVLNEFIEEAFEQIRMVGLNEHKYFSELL